MPNTKTTPLMQQYHEIRAQYPDVLLLFQVGDFYELFFDDAKRASSFLGITLTKRGKNNGEPIPLCGVPVHALDHYLVKLVKGGFKVAVCEQLEEAQPGRVVKRGVTRVLTPGTLTDANLLDEKSASYLFSFFPLADAWGLLFGELMTAQLFGTVVPVASHKVVESELIRFFPDEILLPDNKEGKQFQSYFKKLGYFTSFEDSQEQQEAAQFWLQQQFDTRYVQTLDQHAALKSAVYNFYAYVRKNQEPALTEFKKIRFYKPEDFLILDPATQHHLELVKNCQDGGRRNTLFSLMDKAVTPMGSRMIKKWLMRPLVKKEAIIKRQDAVARLVSDVSCAQQVMQALAQFGDIERIVGRIALGRAPVSDFLVLKEALGNLPLLKNILAAMADVLLCARIAENVADFSSLYALLQVALHPEATPACMIKKGFDQRLDELRELVEHGGNKILALEQQEQKATGIGSLKIRYNQVHGYYIEVTKPNVHLVPEHYTRRQTLVAKERYVTRELSALQHDMLTAQNQIACVEKEVFDRVKHEVRQQLTPLRKCAQALAQLDALLGLAMVAYNNGYVRPTFNASREINITAGRHPVVEQNLQMGFVPNDTALTDDESLWIITGPNMGGKSTYLRQVALISVMAQTGSFVSAQKADVPLLDRIFTRIGAGDNVAEGKSTFLVEMEETAHICTQATERSLVILDEVGRGTSTFDGLAIAQAVVEYLYTAIKARCLFATHYHELTLLQDQYPGIKSYYAASSKTKQGILFLYKMVRGVADGSYGVEVAKLAQLPAPLINRAQQILTSLTAQEHNKMNMQVVPAISSSEENKELMRRIIQLETQLAQQKKLTTKLRSLDYETLSVKEALQLFWELKDSS